MAWTVQSRQRVEGPNLRLPVLEGHRVPQPEVNPGWSISKSRGRYRGPVLSAGHTVADRCSQRPVPLQLWHLWEVWHPGIATGFCRARAWKRWAPRPRGSFLAAVSGRQGASLEAGSA